MNNLEKRVFELSEPIAIKNGAILDSVSYVNEGGIWFLRILIDATDGVNIDMCTAISEEIASITEIDDMIENEYYLEVSSLGIERELRNIEEQKRFCGEYVHVLLKQKINNLMEFGGYLKEVNDDTFSVEVNLKGRKKTFTFNQSDLKMMRLAIKF